MKRSRTKAIVKALRKYRYNFDNEIMLQMGIAEALKENRIKFEREVSLGDPGIIDFMVGTIGIEIKIKGSPSKVGRQVVNYLTSDKLTEIIVVTTKAKAAAFLRVPELLGKRVTVVDLWDRNF
jgi:hypothetical protein